MNDTSEVRVASSSERAAWRALAEVPDPEIPVLNVVELGVIRYVRGDIRRQIEVGVSPTYTGCPATEVIQRSIKEKLESAGFDDVKVTTVISPPWTSDWLTDSAREKLREYGIAPPVPRHLLPSPACGGGVGRGHREPNVRCPRCASPQTERVSEFASTPCKALYRCTACLEPFEYFKCI